MQHKFTHWKQRARRGSVVVEFAFLAPVLVVLVLGMAEASRLLDIQNHLATAARQGSRLAAMDRTDMLGDGQTTNQKITDDIQNFLDACGLPGDQASVIISGVDSPGAPFDLDDPANDLELFQVLVEMPYSAVNPLGSPDATLTAKVVFRNARAAIVQ